MTNIYRQNMQHMPTSNLPDGTTNSLERRLQSAPVAAIDESYSSTNGSRLTYIAVVCLLRYAGHGQTLPRLDKVLKVPERNGIVVTALVLPPWTTAKELGKIWRQGVWYGLAYTNEVLQRNSYRPIGVAFIDGQEPKGFWSDSNEGQNGRVQIEFASKNGTRTYEPGVNPFGVKLLKLADAVVKDVRHQIEGENGLENRIKQLASEQPYVHFVRGLAWQK